MATDSPQAGTSAGEAAGKATSSARPQPGLARRPRISSPRLGPSRAKTPVETQRSIRASPRPRPWVSSSYRLPQPSARGMRCCGDAASRFRLSVGSSSAITFHDHSRRRTLAWCRSPQQVQNESDQGDGRSAFESRGHVGWIFGILADVSVNERRTPNNGDPKLPNMVRFRVASRRVEGDLKLSRKLAAA
jgi:hypothetical protein